MRTARRRGQIRFSFKPVYKWHAIENVRRTSLSIPRRLAATRFQNGGGQVIILLLAVGIVETVPCVSPLVARGCPVLWENWQYEIL